MKILALRAENFKRLSVVQITPSGHIVEVTGANAQGKSSVLDAIWAALGGKDAVPDKPIRTGKKSARIEVRVGDGDGTKYIVERTFTEKETYLKVTDAEGSKHASPQRILDGLMGAIGYDPLIFMRLDGKKQFEMLRGVVKIGVDLDALDRKRATIYEQRTLTNRDLERARSVAASIAVPDLPEQEPDVAAIMDRLAGVDAHNANVRELQREIEDVQGEHAAAQAIEAEALAALERARKAHEEAVEAHEDARVQTQRCRDNAEAAKLQVIPDLRDPTAIRAELDAANAVKEGFRLQAAKIEADATVTTLQRESEAKTAAIKEIEETKQKAIAGAQMPVEGLGFTDGAVTFNGLPLAQASSAEQLRVSASIGAALNPKLRVLLVRDGSLLDSKSLASLAEFAEKDDLQVWVEKVDESGEVGVVLVDGHVKGQEAEVEAFERGETTAATEGDKPAEVDPERMKRVEEFLEGQLAMLETRTTVMLADKDNAVVREKLKHFPEIVAERWTPVYLAKLKKLTKK